MSQIFIKGAGGAGTLSTLTGDAGGAISPVLGDIILAGGIGISTSGAGNTITITATGGVAWTEVTAATVTLAGNTNYRMNRATAITATLPVLAAVDTVIEIVGHGAGLTIIAQNAGQSIHVDENTTTPGAGGTLTATHRYNCIKIHCVVANTEWVVSSSVGNWTIV